MGGHRSAVGVRRSLLATLAGAAGAAAVLVTGGGYPSVDTAPGPTVVTSAQSQPKMVAGRASRTAWRVIELPKALPVGVAPERGLQIRTILVARSISAEFPQIAEIGGVRPDGMRWHPDGLAVDVMIPNPGSAEGIALGDRVVAFALANAERFGLQDAIWRGVYYTPAGPGGGGYGHFDHVHITTTGGGYPTGREVYIR